MPSGIGYGGGPMMGPPTDAANLGVPEPSAVPGAVGDIDSMLAQLKSGQIGAEQLLPLLFLLMAQATGGPMGGMPAGPAGPPPPEAGSPIDAAMMDMGAPPGGASAPPGGAIPPELMALLGGGGF